MIRDKRGQAAPKPGARTALSAAAAVVLAAFALAPTGALAEDSVAWGQKIWQDKAGCNYCHGWAGDGVGGFHHPGRPPSLRATELTRDQIRVTIQCGRPGTSMPHFDRFAYTDKRCYDMTAADLGDQMPDRSHHASTRRNRRARRLCGDKDQGLGQGYPTAMLRLLRRRDSDLPDVRSQEPMSAIRSRRSCCASLEAEHEQHRGVLDVLVLRRLGQHALRDDVGADQNGHILLSVNRIGHRRRGVQGAGVKAPEHFQGLVVQRVAA